MTRKWWSLLLTLCMALCALCMTAMAAEGDVAKIGETGYATLQAAIDAAEDGDTIELLADVSENVTVTEKVGIYLTIDGANKSLNGKIAITALSDTNDNRRLTIKNINFVNSGDAGVDFITSNETNHYPRLTVQNCSFTGNGKDADVAIRTKSAYDLIIEDCIGTGLHSFLQNTSGVKVTVRNVTLTDSKGGLAMGTAQNVTIRGCDLTTRTYGIRLDAVLDTSVTLNGNNVEAYIPVSVRKATAENYMLSFSGSASSYTASNADEVWCAICATEYEDGVTLNEATGNVKITWNTDVLDADGVYGAYSWPIEVVYGDGYTKGFDSLASAMSFGYSGSDEKTIIVHEDITESMGSLEGNITTDNPDGVTIKNTIVDEWIYCSENFIIGEGVTYDATGYNSGLFMYAKDAVINGTVITDCYYQRYADTKLTINEPGSMTVKTETFILRYTDGDGEAGVYIVGDNNDETIGLTAAVIYFYQGMINAKDADIKVSTYWQTNTTDNEGSANLVLDNSNMTVTVNEHNMKATGNSTVTLTNGSAVSVAGGYEGVAVLADDTSSFTKNGNNIFVARVGDYYTASLQAAIDAAEDGDTITLLRDVTVSGQKINDWYEGVYYEGNKSFTIDLGGFKLTNDSTVTDYLMLIKNVGSKANEITIKNGTLEATSSAYCAICTSSGSTQQITINLENVNIIGNNSNGSVVKVRGGTVLNVKSGTEITGTDSYLGVECIASTANIYDGAEIYMNGTTSYNGCLVGVGSNGTVNVYSGYGKSAAGGFIVMTSGGTINVSGGEWIANTDGTYADSNFSVLIAQNDKNTYPSSGKSLVSATGGTFKGGYNCYGAAAGDAQLNIFGGSFNADPTAYIGEGCEVVINDGIHTVQIGEDAVAVIGAKPYTSLAAAIAAAQEGDTVQLLPGTIEEGTVKLPASLKDVTFVGGEGVVLKNMTIMAADGNSISYESLTFDGITFENSRISITGWRNGGASVKDLTVTNCVFKNLEDSTNSAAVHINMSAADAINGFTFTNNVIDGATGGSKSGIYAQLTGKVVIADNVINNVAFRPYVIQITTDDGIDDEFTVTGNTFSGSAAGRAQGLGNNSSGTDNVTLTVSGNIFQDITNAQQICYWSFNPETTTADLSGNYYDIDISKNPSKIYYNSAAANIEDLAAYNVYPVYTRLNADGSIDLSSAYEPVASIGTVFYDTLTEAVEAAADNDEIVLYSDNNEKITVGYDLVITLRVVEGKVFAGELKAGTNTRLTVDGNVYTFDYTPSAPVVVPGGNKPVTPDKPSEPADPADPADPVIPTEPEVTYTDVTEETPCYESIVYVTESGLMNGVGDDKFAPAATLNRAMIVTVLHRLENEPDVSADDLFTDVADTHWYDEAVTWAAESGVVNGYGDGTFGPEDAVTVQQVAVILYRYALLKGYDVTAAADLSAYADAANVADWALAAMQWAVANGLLTLDNGLLSAEAAASRAQIAYALHNFMTTVIGA